MKVTELENIQNGPEYEKLLDKQELEYLRKKSKADFWFTPIYIYLAVCFVMAANHFKLYQIALYSLIPTIISIFVIGIIKHLLYTEFLESRRTDIPTIIYLLILLSIPILVFIVLR